MVTIFELFRPEEYFSLNVRVNMGGSNLNLTWLDGERITDRGQLNLIYSIPMCVCRLSRAGAV